MNEFIAATATYLCAYVHAKFQLGPCYTHFQADSSAPDIFSMKGQLVNLLHERIELEQRDSGE